MRSSSVISKVIQLFGLVSITLFALYNNLYYLLLLLPAYVLCIIFMHIKSQRRLIAFEKDFPVFLVLLSSTIKCGLDPFVALFESKKLFPPESIIYQELSKLVVAYRAGQDHDFVIKNFAHDIPYPERDLFIEAFLLARKQGSSLSGCLERIVRVVRNRQSFRRKAKSALAMQKLSAFGIAIAVISIFIVQFISAREILISAWDSELGFKLLLTSGVLVVSGFIYLGLLVAKGDYK